MQGRLPLGAGEEYEIVNTKLCILCVYVLLPIRKWWRYSELEELWVVVETSTEWGA